jgi:hypothetical protein
MVSLPLSIPIVNTIVTGLVIPLKSAPEPFAVKANILLASDAILMFKLTLLIVPAKTKLPLRRLKECDGTITEKDPICMVVFSVTGLIPLVFARRVKESCKTTLENFGAISSLAAESGLRSHGGKHVGVASDLFSTLSLEHDRQLSLDISIDIENIGRRQNVS